VFGNDFQRRGFDAAEQQAIVMVRDAPQLGLRCMVSPYEELPTIEATKKYLLAHTMTNNSSSVAPCLCSAICLPTCKRDRFIYPHCVLVTKWRLSPFTCIRRQYER
jgi:hypothetical protein